MPSYSNAKTSGLEPTAEYIGIDDRYNWTLPIRGVPSPEREIREVWYVALPISSAHRGGHSGGGASIPGVGGQEIYENEGTVYPHAALVELVTSHTQCFPSVAWKYVDLSHEPWQAVRAQIQSSPPDIAALSVYTSTAIWAYIVAAEVKLANPAAIVVFGNDHASILYQEILSGAYGSRLVDFIGLGNNGPYTMMGLIYSIRGQLPLSAVPSIAYKRGSKIVRHDAPTYPLALRPLPNYWLIEEYLSAHYDRAFRHWYADFYHLPRMVTVQLDGGCHWGENPDRRCMHCSIYGLTPKTRPIETIVPFLEDVVGQLGANVYCAGDSTLGFSLNQWRGNYRFLNELAEACESSNVLSHHRFMLCYGLVREFLSSAALCRKFVKTWNVGIEAFDPMMLRADSKGVNRGEHLIMEAFELAEHLDYRIYASGILGLPGTTVRALRQEVDKWLNVVERFKAIITTVSVALPAILPGSRMYYDCMSDQSFAEMHGELLPAQKMTEYYIRTNTDVALADVQAALLDIGRGVISLGSRCGTRVKFGGYMLGGRDPDEGWEHDLLNSVFNKL